MDFFTKGLLEKKYAQQDEQNAIARLQAQNTGMLQTAQAAESRTRTNLMPGTVASENAFRDVNAQQTRLGLGFIAPRAQADIDAIRAGIGLTNARVGTERAQAGLYGAQTGLAKINTTLLDDTRVPTGITMRRLGLAPTSSLFSGSQYGFGLGW